MIRSYLAACWLYVGIGLAVPVLARDIYVDNQVGDDRRDGSTPQVTGQAGGPYRTIARALRDVELGDRVILAKTDQPYRESVTLQAARHSGTPRQPFELIGNGAILDGSRPIPPGGWEHVREAIFRYRPARSSFQVLYLGDRPADRRPVDRAQGLPALEPLEWSLYERFLYFRAEAGKTPRDYSLACTDLTVGITLYDVHHVIIRDLIVQGFQIDGVNAHDNVFSGQLVGLTCRGNGRSGISVGGACRVRAIDCLVSHNGAAQVRSEGRCKAELINCELLDHTAPGVVRDGGEVLVSATPPAP